MKGRSTVTRRAVLKLSAGLLGSAVLDASAFGHGDQVTRFGLIADVHHGLANRSVERLGAFVSEASSRDLSFVAQLGDFNHPLRSAREFLNVWTEYRGPRFGVLGNHDMDYGYKEDAIEWWQIPDRFYSFDSGHLHFVVLDANNIFDNGNFVPYANSNFYLDQKRISHVDDEQLDWLAMDLRQTWRQTIVFVHQAIDEIDGGGLCLNRHRVRALLEEANRQAGFTKVIACFQGHHHKDQYEMRRGIHYVRVNSASYFWLGDRFGRTADYQEPLFCFVTVTDDTLVIEGRQGSWTPPSPTERKYPGAEKLSPHISDRRLRLT